MILQNFVDGVLVGSFLSLGAIGLTLVMHILRFANFSHAELLSIGAYSALVCDALLQALMPLLATKIGPLSMTLALALAVVASMALTALSALVIDQLVFKRIRERGEELSMVFASFGMALIMRNLVGLGFGLHPQLYAQDIAFAMILSRDPLLLVKPDQVFVFGATIVIVIALHLTLSRTHFGFALRALAENPTLAQIHGVNLRRMIAAVWLLGGVLAAAAGVFYGLSYQLSPVMGRDLVLPIFAATIVGGIGSVYGAVLGGFIVGLASNLALVILPSGYSPSMPFLLILLVLLVRPHGLLGEARA